MVADALTRIRDRDTPNALFRQNLERIGTLLLAEATRTLPTVDGTVETPLTTAPARRIASQPVVVPILRAGLGFVGAAQELLPNADLGFIGMARNEDTHQPEPYVNKLPESLAGRPVIVVDPMLATGGSLIATIELLRERGAPEPITVVCALAAPEGIAARSRRPGCRSISSPRRSTTISTSTRSSSPASATPATVSSARPAAPIPSS